MGGGAGVSEFQSVPGNHRPCILEAVRAGVVAAYRGDSRERPAKFQFPARGWLRFFAYPLIDSAGGTVDQIDGHVPQPTRTSCATSLFHLPRLAVLAGDFVE